MINQLIIVMCLTFIIHLISTLSYAVRIVSIRTKKVALTISLFNILVLVSRTANTFQAPLLSKIVETDLNNGLLNPRSNWFSLIIASSTFASIIGIILIPTFQRILTHAVEDFGIFKSIPRLIRKAFSLRTQKIIHSDLALPKKGNAKFSSIMSFVSWKYVIMNMVASAVITIGVIASLYAGYLNPNFRTTSSSLSSIINGFATIFMIIFIDPYLSVMVDDTINGKMPEIVYRRYMVLLLISRVIGTILAQFLLFPAAWVISKAAQFI